MIGSDRGGLELLNFASVHSSVGGDFVSCGRIAWDEDFTLLRQQSFKNNS